MSSTIAELFARNPLKHSDADIAQIVEHFRQTRKDFKAAGNKAPKPLTKAEQEVKTSGLDFDI